MDTIKGGEFLVKEINADDIFISEEFSEEQKMMKEAVIEFIDREVWPHKDRFENNDYAFTEEVMRKVGEMGFLGISISRAIWRNWNGICFNNVSY